jgi:sugar/nucleoside kinase (ribokinase family)
MKMKNQYDLVCIGNYTKDTIISPAGVKYVDGGAINYAAHAAARLGRKVAVVTRLADEDLRVVDKFQSDGIDCFVTFTPSSTCMKLEYPTHNPDIRTLSVTGTAGSITAKDVDGIEMSAAAIGTSLRGEVGTDVIRTLRGKNVFLGADMQGFVRVLRDRTLVNETWPEMEETLPYLDVLKSDAVEAEFLTGEADIFQAARLFSQMGASEIILTHKDGVLVYADGQFYPNSFHSRNLDGRSGRGDTCLGAYMAMRSTLNPFEAGIWAAAVTSLKMDRLGPYNRSYHELTTFIEKNYTFTPTHP